LLYWTRPEYAKFLRFPQCIHFLRLLQDPDLRRELTQYTSMPEIEGQQLRYFELYRRNRLDLGLPDVEVRLPATWPPAPTATPRNP
jgi:mediator of RNA polymerase II transcription subunit 31